MLPHTLRGVPAAELFGLVARAAAEIVEAHDETGMVLGDFTLGDVSCDWSFDPRCGDVRVTFRETDWEVLQPTIDRLNLRVPRLMWFTLLDFSTVTVRFKGRDLPTIAGLCAPFTDEENNNA